MTQPLSNAARPGPAARPAPRPLPCPGGWGRVHRRPRDSWGRTQRAGLSRPRRLGLPFIFPLPRPRGGLSAVSVTQPPWTHEDTHGAWSFSERSAVSRASEGLMLSFQVGKPRFWPRGSRAGALVSYRSVFLARHSASKARPAPTLARPLRLGVHCAFLAVSGWGRGRRGSGGLLGASVYLARGRFWVWLGRRPAV